MTVRPDNRLTDAPMASVVCRQCGANVLARKSTWEQTSVQWDAEGLALCRQRHDARMLSQHSGRPIFLGCSELTASILDAACHGGLAIVEE